jgi:hypothetical protein
VYAYSNTFFGLDDTDSLDIFFETFATGSAIVSPPIPDTMCDVMSFHSKNYVTR